MDSRVKFLIEQGDDLFGKRTMLTSLWQEIADNFYVERADFTVKRSIGQDFAGYLTTSYPILARRDLGNAFGSMLRPNDRDWFFTTTTRMDMVDNAGKRWLEAASLTQRRAMYDRASQFVRATKEGDHDFAAFGQCVISVELNKNADALLYRCWHLRDVAWCENEEGKVDTIHRKWEPTNRMLISLFGDKCASQVKDNVDKNPYVTVNVRHIVIPSSQYQSDKTYKTPYVSIYIDVDNQYIMEEVGVYNTIYVIPRWQTVSGSQYAYSPATVAALPDARLIQAITLTLLEAGQKSVDPPMIAVQEALRGDMQFFAGGVTFVDDAYDERLGEVLRPITQDRSGMPTGYNMRADIREMISQAFFLNKLNLPQMSGERTAYEIGQRVQEYIRSALPLFEPMEMDYNGAICEQTFDILMRGGAFGSAIDMPQSLRGQQIHFRFESPLHRAVDHQKGQTLLEAKGLLADAIALDPSAQNIIDVNASLRDALEGIGVPATWIRSQKDADQLTSAQQQQQQVQQTLALMQQGGEAGQAIGQAGQALQQIPMQGGRSSGLPAQAV